VRRTLSTTYERESKRALRARLKSHRRLSLAVQRSQAGVVYEDAQVQRGSEKWISSLDGSGDLRHTRGQVEVSASDEGISIFSLTRIYVPRGSPTDKTNMFMSETVAKLH
jgi:hypothetical protein